MGGTLACGSVISGYFQSNANSSVVAVGGSRGIIITGNYLARTLPACNGTATNQSTGKTYNSWTDFGMGPIYLPSGTMNPSYPASSQARARGM